MPIKNPSTSLRTGIIPGQRIARAKLQRACELRQAMTAAEKALWQELRSNKSGIHFRRQQIIAGFIVDFYCHKADLVVEVDGEIHDLQPEEDARRETVLKGMGFTIVRFSNEDLIQHLPGVVRKIKSLTSL